MKTLRRVASHSQLFVYSMYIYYFIKIKTYVGPKRRFTPSFGPMIIKKNICTGLKTRHVSSPVPCCHYGGGVIDTGGHLYIESKHTLVWSHKDKKKKRTGASRCVASRGPAALES